MSNIIDLFIQAAQQQSTKTAIVFKDNTISYQDLLQQVKVTGAYYKSKGIQKGHRVLVFIPMSIDLYRNVLSILYIGATPVFLDEWVSKSRMEECCKVANCHAFIGTTKVRILSFLSSGLRKIKLKLSSSLPKFKILQNDYQTVDKEDTALITFTTGSTGRPKAAKRTHGFLHAQFKVLIEKIEPSPEDIDMTTLPIVLLMNLGIGSTTIIPNYKSSKPQSLDPEIVIQQLRYYSVNRLICSPYFVQQLANNLLNTNKSLEDLNIIFTGGAPVFRNDAKILRKAFPDAHIEIIYGSTEAEPISSINVDLLIDNKLNNDLGGLNVGTINPHTKLGIIEISHQKINLEKNSNISDLFLSPYTIGEIIVSGPHVLQEYFNNPEAIQLNKIKDGTIYWHRTGDSGFIDDAGILYLTGRCNTLIKIKDITYSTFVFENYLQNIKGISCGTIFYKKDQFYILLELNKDYNKTEIENKIGNLNLPDYKILYVNKLPRDPRHFSKIEYSKLDKLIP